MRATMLMPTFYRDDCLRLGLTSVTRQPVEDIEILVLNDGPQSEQTREIAESFGATYIHTGVRFNDNPDANWRVPGFPFNIGAKMAKADILILTCPEMWHMEPYTIQRLLVPVIADPMAIGITDGRRDTGLFHTAVLRDINASHNAAYGQIPMLRTELPFLMALRTQLYLDIGGYDEDFTGSSYDDGDFVGRLKVHGCRYVKVKARCVHLAHPKTERAGLAEMRAHNKRLKEERAGIVVRNVGREWGVIR